MLAWLWRLLVVGRPERPGLNALRGRVEAVEKLLELFIAEVKEQRGRISAVRRREKPSEDAPGETIEEPASPPSPRQNYPTISDGRRRRGGSGALLHG